MTARERQAVILTAPEYLAHYRRRFFAFDWSGQDQPTFLDRYKAMYLRLYINARRQLAAARRGL